MSESFIEKPKMIAMKPFFSIVIPTFNRYEELKRSIGSVLAQSFENWELLVIDDGSVDDTPVLMEAYCSSDPRIFYYQRPKDRIKGATCCKNIGVEMFESTEKHELNFCQLYKSL